MRLIDADKADVERISCFYGSECCLADVQEWMDEQPTFGNYGWISVDEGLPDIDPCGKGRYGGARSVRVLCACKQRDGKTFVKEGYYEPCGNGNVVWRIPGSIDSVTHWMLLPEPPKDQSAF